MSKSNGASKCPEHMAYTRDHIPQIQQNSRKKWTPAVEAQFLDVLSTTCNATRACAEIGWNYSVVYARRRKSPEFAARWQKAWAAGYERVEQLLLQNAVETLEGWQPDPDLPMPRMTVAEALTLVRMEKLVRADPSKRRGSFAKWKSLDDVRASIVRKLAAIERAAAREKERDALKETEGAGQ
ncbi:MAG: hypothetical protein V4530_15015 [Pseudomonadota bacterium]